MNDIELLRQYAEERSETAFQELVQRKVGLVHAAAIRQVGGDAHLANDVTQAVFSALAVQARALARHPALTGWLYTSTRNAAAKVVRAERRRQRWETEASLMNTTFAPAHPSAAAGWDEIAGVLDESMHELNADDREAVLLRYFENQPLAKVGARFGLSEDTARKRVERALDKLRRALERRGVGSAAAALSPLLSQGATTTMPPASLAATVANAALTAGATESAAVAGLAFLTIGKSTLAAGAALAVLAIGTAFVVSDRRDSVAPPAPARPLPPGAGSAVASARPAAIDDYDTSNIKILAAALVARPPGKERFAVILSKLGGNRQNTELFRELGRLDFSSALRLADLTESADLLKARAVWGFAEVNPHAALKWALDHPRKGGESTIANFHLQNWAAGAFGPQRAALYAYIDSLPPDQAVLTPRHDAISGIEHHARILRSYRELFEDPRAPALIVSLRSDPRVTGGLPDGRLLALASSWARDNPEEFLPFAARATDPFFRRALLDAAVGPYVELDPARALDWAMGVDADGSLGIVSRGINEWINRSGDPEAALRWAKADPGRQTHVDLVAGIVAARIGDKNYHRAYEIAFTIATESTRQKTLENVAVYWRKDDTHFEYVKRSGNPELMSASVVHLAEKQPGRAAELIALMPPGRLKVAAEERLRNAPKTSGR